MELPAKNTRPVHSLGGETASQSNDWSRPGTRSLKLAEACASRTHRRHQRCRPPVLKTGTDTGLLTLPFCDQSMLMRAAEGEDGLKGLGFPLLRHHGSIRRAQTSSI